MTAPTATSSARPATVAYVAHVARCPAGGDLRRCAECRGLEADASAEDGRRWGWPS